MKKFEIKCKGRPINGLKSSISVSYEYKKVSALFDAISDCTKLPTTQLRLLVKNRVLKKEDDICDIPEEECIYVKDLGPQIAWKTVFLIEYMGPLWIHPLIYGNPLVQRLLVVFVLVLLHYIKRELETLWVHRFSMDTMPRRNLFKNSFHYWILGGVNMAYWSYGPWFSSIYQPRIALIFFVILWIFSEYANFKTHLILRNLRPAQSRVRQIPKGFGFNLVSCPNYFFEYTSWLIVALISRSLSSWIFLTVSGVQMWLWAFKKHTRYITEFENYPKQRKNMPAKYSSNINPKKSLNAVQSSHLSSCLNTETLKSLTIKSCPEIKADNLNKVYLNSYQLKRAGLNTGDPVLIENESSLSRYLFGIAWMNSGVGFDEVILSDKMRKKGNFTLGQCVSVKKYPEQLFKADNIEIESLDCDLRHVLLNKIKDFFLKIKYISIGSEYEYNHHGKVIIIKIKTINDQSEILNAIREMQISDKNIYPNIFFVENDTKLVLSSNENITPKITFSSIGGLKRQIELLKDYIEMPLLKPQYFQKFNISPPKGVLLYGPPGTGKTMLLRAIANETNAYVELVNGPSIVGKYLGETETNLVKIFENAKKHQPSIIFIDEIDAIAPKRSEDTVDRRVVASLLTLMDGMNSSGQIVVVGATNRPNTLDEALRRPGRFEKEIEIGVPDADARLEILKLNFDKMPHNLNKDDIENLAKRTHGYVGADLTSICREAAISAIKHGIAENISEENFSISKHDIEIALKDVRQSVMREVFLETPHVRWSDIGGQQVIKQKLREAIEWPLTHPQTFLKLGIVPPKGILLYGPPGCSKTLIAKAAATEAGINFFAIKGPEVFNKYVGESERTIREIFRKARLASPSMIFFDEIDALSINRGSGEETADRVLSALLNELDGIESLTNVTILAATNRPDVIDHALIRPGRFDRIIYVGLPDLETRKDIFKIKFKTMNVSNDVDIDELSEKTDGCSGAEISALCQDAGINAMYDDINAVNIEKKHFDKALTSLKNLIYESKLLSRKITNLGSNIKKKRKKWVLPPLSNSKEMDNVMLKKETLLKTPHQKLINYNSKKNNSLKLWKKQKIALKEKFPEGWNPLKKLSPDTINQIKILRQENPTYTASILSNMFKVSPEAIRRILKSKWQPSPEEYADKLARWKKRGIYIRNMWIRQKHKNDKI
ncbi:hypothetical protein PORY_002534 [Pneumocystis oryctolagi]|uniref:Uncharacterized protein n=1 Tax=Pneumocystis oryctolagi TaxID=42067 RepID=A0ACB7C8Z4_9ASCO|nr:hypothetical protein PORY_002534 [Pneumocystis oryctolagi]